MDLSYIPGYTPPPVQQKKIDQNQQRSRQQSMKLLRQTYSEQEINNMISKLYPEYKPYKKIQNIVQQQMQDMPTGNTKKAQSLYDDKKAEQSYINNMIKNLEKKYIQDSKKTDLQAILKREEQLGQIMKRK